MMQTSPCRTDENTAKYGTGAFAFMCGALLTGMLIGTMCCCLSADTQVSRLLSRSGDMKSLLQTDPGSVMAGSLLGSTVFLLGLAVAGFCAVGQPFAVLLIVLRGMGMGHKAAQLYSTAGRGDILYAAGLFLPGAVISALALAAAAREALSLSNIYLRLTLSGGRGYDPSGAVRLYGAKMLVIEAMLALAAGADTICRYLFTGKLI